MGRKKFQGKKWKHLRAVQKPKGRPPKRNLKKYEKYKRKVQLITRRGLRVGHVMIHETLQEVINCPLDNSCKHL